MAKNIIFDESKLENEVFRLYELHAMGYYLDYEDEHYFDSIPKAIDYSLQSAGGDYEPYELIAIIYSKRENGELVNEEVRMGILPNQLRRKVSFEAEGEQVNDSLIVKKLYFSSSSSDDYYYSASISLNSNNELEYDYELVQKESEKNSPKTRKRK